MTRLCHLLCAIAGASDHAHANQVKHAVNFMQKQVLLSICSSTQIPMCSFDKGYRVPKCAIMRILILEYFDFDSGVQKALKIRQK